jgi:hypothetical protein
MSDTVSVDSIRAQIPHNVLTRVLGEPTHSSGNSPPTFPVLGVTARVTWAYFKIPPSTQHATVKRSPSLPTNHQHTPSCRTAPLPLNAENCAPTTSLPVKHGPRTNSSSPSPATSLPQPLTTYTTPSSTTHQRTQQHGPSYTRPAHPTGVRPDQRTGSGRQSGQVQHQNRPRPTPCGLNTQTRKMPNLRLRCWCTNLRRNIGHQGVQTCHRQW